MLFLGNIKNWFPSSLPELTKTASSANPCRRPKGDLTNLRKPLRTTLALHDFSQHTLKQVINHVLTMDIVQNSNPLSTGSLQSVLLKIVEVQFRQAVQCATCLNSGHLTVMCTLRSHCLICHSRAHTPDQCEYNLLNYAAALVR